MNLIWPLECKKRQYLFSDDQREDKNKFISFRSVFLVCLFVFVALRPMSTAMVIAGRSVHLTTLFPGQA